MSERAAPLTPLVAACHRRDWLQAALGAVVAGAWGARRSFAQPATATGEWLTPAARQAIDKGLAFLAAGQKDDGTLGDTRYGQNVAIVAVGGLAFLASGSTPGRGPYGVHVDRCLEYLLANESESGFINVPAAASHGPMYEHGFATLFLAEAYGMSQRADLRDKLARAIRLIVETQNDQGGWRYQPQRADADISVTICQIMALRAARNAGIYVPRQTVERCIDYVKRSQNPDGGFMYMLSGGLSAFPRSAAGVVALYSAGVYQGAEIERGLEFVMQFLPEADSMRQEIYYFYGHYYAVQAMWLAGGDYWAKWFPAIRDQLVALQQPTGEWVDSYSNEYATSMACIILQVPNHYLPIFQR